MRHFACPGGCGGRSPKLAECQDESCPNFAALMAECECRDGHHAELLETGPAESEDQDDSDWN